MELSNDILGKVLHPRIFQALMNIFTINLGCYLNMIQKRYYI